MALANRSQYCCPNCKRSEIGPEGRVYCPHCGTNYAEGNQMVLNQGKMETTFFVGPKEALIKVVVPAEKSNN